LNAKDFQCFIFVKVCPSELEHIEESIKVSLEDEMHVRFLFVVKAKHDFLTLVV